MELIFYLMVFLSLGVFIARSTAGDALDANVFLQNDYQVKFERLEIVSYNKDIMKDLSMKTFKYNRTTAVVNATFTFKVDIGKDMTAIVQAYKFMSNEYRYFPMRFAVNGWKAIAANVAGSRRSFNCGNFTGCPMKKGVKYHICNWSPDPEKLPPLIPNGEYKIEAQLLHSSQEMFVMDGYITIFRPIRIP